MKSILLAFALVVCVAAPALSQDAVSFIDDAPLVSAVLLKSLEKTPAFTGTVQVVVAASTEPSPSTAIGAVEYDHGSLRWDVRLNDVKSPQLNSSARAIVRQINGDELLAIASQSDRANFLVLNGSRAYLEQPLPSIKLAPARARGVTEKIDEHVCVKEQFSATYSGGHSNQVQVWKAKELRGVPSMLQVAGSGETIRVVFQDIRLHGTPAERFTVPAGYAQYNSLEDLVQSVVISKVKRRMGLE